MENQKQADYMLVGYCYVLQPRADSQPTKIPFRIVQWENPYAVEKTLEKNSYKVPKN